MCESKRIVDPNTFTGRIEDKNIVKRFIKRVLKKSFDWYLYPWGILQNQFNREIQNELQEKENALKQVNKLHDEKLDKLEFGRMALCDLTEELYHSLKQAQHDIEQLQLCCNLGLENKYTISPQVEEMLSIIKEKKDTDVTDIGTMFQEQLKKAQSTREYIVLICADFSNGRNMEAIRKEAYYIFNKIKQCSVLLPILVSLKMDSDEFFEDNDIFYVGDRQLPNFLNSLRVKMIVWNCPVINYAHCAEDVSLKYPTLMRLTSQNPLQMDEEDISGYALETLLHVNDYGFMHIMTMSEYAKKQLETVGFKNVAVCLPQIDITGYQRKSKTGTQRIIGFASSPMLETQIENRGIVLLAQVAEICIDYKFKVLWRNESLIVPEELSKCQNVEIIYGLMDMNDFYEEIDSLIIPYNSYNDNHGCSLSAIEAMLFGIPVIATDISGVSELIKKLGCGLVSQPNVGDLCDAIKELYNNYAFYSNVSAYHYLYHLLSDNSIIKNIETIAMAYRPDNIITLDEWNRALQEQDKYLVAGRKNIKKYYSQFSVADHYTEQRFSSLHDKCLDLFERLSIDYSIESKKKEAPLQILDIAPGDGRILQENIKYGDCIAMDASAPMLNLVHERFAGADNLTTIEGDYFVDIISGEFDVITTFRYIRHFSYQERKALYDKIKTNLKQDGVLIFDVPNIKFEMKQRMRNGWGNYNIYDVFWTKEGIVKELNENGFRIHTMIEVGKGLTQDSEEPMTWTVAAIKMD